MAIDLNKAFDHTKHISTLTLPPLSNIIKRWLYAYIKGHPSSCRYNYTHSLFFHARVGGPSLTTLVYPLSYSNFLHPHSPKSNNILTIYYANDDSSSYSIVA